MDSETPTISAAPVSPFVESIIRNIYASHKLSDQVAKLSFLISCDKTMLPESALEKNIISADKEGSMIAEGSDKTGLVEGIILSPCLNKMIKSSAVVTVDNKKNITTPDSVIFELLNILALKNYSKSSTVKNRKQLHDEAKKFAITTMFTDELKIFKEHLSQSNFNGSEDYENLFELVTEELNKRNEKV